jgi:hypothetical protein
MCDVAAAWDQPFRPEAGHAKETLRVDELNVAPIEVTSAA